MGILTKLGKALGGNGKDGGGDAAKPQGAVLGEQITTLRQDGRLHTRYVIEGDGVAWLELTELGLDGVVRDVSYGGLAARLTSRTGPAPAELPAEVTGRLTVLDRVIQVKLLPVRTVSHAPGSVFAGMRFQHDAPESLLFLRQLIEPLRCGKSAAALPADMRNERYRGAEWTCLRGDGPVDIMVRSDGAGGLTEALLTMRAAGLYLEVSFRGGRLRTGRSVGGSGAAELGAGMVDTTELDVATLRQAICTIMGAPMELRPALRALLERLFAALGQYAQLPPRTHISSL